MAATMMNSQISMSRTAQSSSVSARKVALARSAPAAASSLRGVALRTRGAGKGAAARGAVVTMAVKEGDVLLDTKDIVAVIDESGKEILKGVNITIKAGEVHAIMGKNGSGKSTFSKVLVGHPAYRVTGGEATFKGKDLFDMEPEERSHQGLFLSFQSPIEIPGVR
eukprot:175829-Pyramimonas_sp.AAC.4